MAIAIAGLPVGVCRGFSKVTPGTGIAGLGDMYIGPSGWCQVVLNPYLMDRAQETGTHPGSHGTETSLKVFLRHLPWCSTYHPGRQPPHLSLLRFSPNQAAAAESGPAQWRWQTASERGPSCPPAAAGAG